MVGNALRELRSRYRSVFISDLHLGSVGSKATEVRSFLRSFECDHLYLVGDIFDGWVGRGSGKWSQTNSDVVRTILGKSKFGTQVYYTPGNHDSLLRRMNGSELGNIIVDHSFVHRLADGRDLLIEHGDMFDKSCTKYGPVAVTGAWIYEAALYFNNGVNRVRTNRNRKPVDFISVMKRMVKRVAVRRNGFADQLIEHAKSHGCQGVVCGHVHRPEIRELADGFVYVNTGDWVEHCTAVAEDDAGTLTLIDWKATGRYIDAEFEFVEARRSGVTTL